MFEINLNADLAVGLGLPVLVVAPDRLGTLNHTLLTIEAVRMRRLTLAGLILNKSALQTDCMMDNVAGIKLLLQKFPCCVCRTVPEFRLISAGARPL